MKLLLLLPILVLAGPFSITNRDYAGLAGNDEAVSAIDSAFNLLETEVNKSLPDADQSTYLKGMSNASVLSVKGLGTDYTDFDLFVVGGGVGAGAALGSNSLSDVLGGDVDAEALRGVGAQVVLMGGLHLGIFNLPTFDFFDMKKLKFFLSFMSMDLPSLGDEFDGEVSNFGLHLQYKVLDEIDLVVGLVKWGGLDVTLGFEKASLDLTYTKAFNEASTTTATISNADVTLATTFTGTAVAGANVDVSSIPIEVSTNMRLLYFLTLFGGIGFDMNGGDATSIAKLTNSPTVTIDTSGLPSHSGSVSGSPNLDLGTSDGPESSMRWFMGFQFNIVLAHIFFQMHKTFSDNNYALNTGLRISW